MTVQRRRWTDQETADAQWLAGRLKAGQPPRAPYEDQPSLLLSPAQEEMRKNLQVHQGRADFPPGCTALDLWALSRHSACEHGCVRDMAGRLLLVKGNGRRIRVQHHDTVLVHTHIYDLPPSEADLQVAQRTHPAPGLAIIGPDGRVTDYNARGPAPDTQLSYVSDAGLITGQLHKISTQPARPWARRPSAVQKSARVEGSFLGSIGRACTISIMVGRHGLPLLLRRGFRQLSGQEKGKALARCLVDLGPTFIKIGQFLSMRPDWIGSSVAAELNTLRDSVSNSQRKNSTSNKAPNFDPQNISRVDPEPAFTASVADVYRAYKSTGETLAVKVLRPGVPDRLQQDLWLVLATAAFAQRLPGMDLIPARHMVEELATALLDQINLVTEAQTCGQFAKNFHQVPGIYIPTVIDSLSDGQRLTTLWIEDLQPIDHPQLPTAVRKRAARLAVRALYKMIFVDGLVHADLHPGNLHVQPSGDVVLLDFGMVVRLTDTDRRDFAQFFFAMVSNNGSECARIAYESASWCTPDFDRAGFEKAICALVTTHSSRNSGNFGVASFVQQMFKVQRRFGLRSGTAFIGAILSLLGLEGITRQLDPTLDFQGEARHYLGDLLRPARRKNAVDARQNFRTIQGPRPYPRRR